jgi:hypothetical protein
MDAVLAVLRATPMTKMLAKTIADKIDENYKPGPPYSESIVDFAAPNGMNEVTIVLNALVTAHIVRHAKHEGPAGTFGGDFFYVESAE